MHKDKQIVNLLLNQVLPIIAIIILFKLSSNFDIKSIFQTKTNRTHQEYQEFEPKKISLKSIDKKEQFYYEVKGVIIGFDRNEFTIYINSLVDKYKLDYLLLYINQPNNKSVTIEENKLTDTEKWLFNNYLISILESGNTSIYDKDTRKYVDFIYEINYSYSDPGALAGSSGSKFKTPAGKEFITIMTGIM